MRPKFRHAWGLLGPAYKLRIAHMQLIAGLRFQATCDACRSTDGWLLALMKDAQRGELLLSAML